MSESTVCGRCQQPLGSHESISVVNVGLRCWDQVGRMVMAFEGFTLRAVVDDTIEVVGGPLLDEGDP